MISVYSVKGTVLVPSITKNRKSAILKAPQCGRKIAHVRARTSIRIAYSLVGISVIVNKEGRDFSMVEKKRHGVYRSRMLSDSGSPIYIRFLTLLFLN